MITLAAEVENLWQEHVGFEENLPRKFVKILSLIIAIYREKMEWNCALLL